MRDKRGRPLRDLRISVTDNCNFRCTYCMPAQDFPPDYPFLASGDLLSFPEILRVVEACRALGLKKVKLTGGEPLVRSLLPELVLSLKTRWPDIEVGLVTNGLHLKALLPRLVSAGLDGVTVSLDSLEQESFGALTGNGHRVAVVLEAIEAAREALGSVKINTVLLRGENDDQVEPLARAYRRPGFALRFIEFMDVGTLNRWNRQRVVTGAEVKARLEALEPGLGLVPLPKAHPGETSERWAWSDGQGSVGFINSVTQPFCGDCSRVRLGPDGTLYTCLFSSRGFDLRTPLRAGASALDLEALVGQLWSGREDRYSELRTDGSGPKVEMFAVGG